MATVKAAILGFGTVGQGIYRIVNERKEQLAARTGAPIEIAAILVRNLERPRPDTPGVLVTDRFEDILAIPDLDVVFEAIVGEEPAGTYLEQAIAAGCHVVTANKVMYAKAGASLEAFARESGTGVGYEATVAGGVPVIKTIQNLNLANSITGIQGILNGTSNFILTKMRKEECSFADALKEAQELGYAEADPTNDVSGFDAFCKLMILSGLAFGEQPDWEHVPMDGIDKLTLDEVIDADRQGLRYRHIADVRRGEDGEILASVGPVLIGPDHPLYGVDGVDNAVAIETAYAGTLTVTGPGAGMYPTASVMVEDAAVLLKQPFRKLVTD
ncbi:homoserine dehydrogenase [Edaphobacillus lindanitolerans]|uniref:Homoserine dehydrogenase n=1 Tax=Edaphobacillus lindanitolerans TaxID=550447 RepID=A0A1U7PP26_9BACI|nr:homoserine dehydrogenase [Edaphobacillus lindanitolerans]SIT75280.1 homoserine dehydrogenase [Edaphobacillus lindanitolerans]